MKEYDSVESLLAAEESRGIHIECSTAVSEQVREVVRQRYGQRRCAFMLCDELGFERESARSYLMMFARIAGRGRVAVEKAIAHFGLVEHAKRKLQDCPKAERTLVDIARVSLAEPEVCFCERPLFDLGAQARRAVLTWMAERVEHGTIFITTAEPLREALLMPGSAFWYEDGRFIAAEVAEGDGSEDAAKVGDVFLGDEVRVCKIPAKTESATLLLDPKDIDFVESMNELRFGTRQPLPDNADHGRSRERARAVRVLPLPSFLYRQRAEGFKGRAVYAQQLQPDAQRCVRVEHPFGKGPRRRASREIRLVGPRPFAAGHFIFFKRLTLKKS